MNGFTIYIQGHPVEVNMEKDGSIRLQVGYSDGSDCPIRCSLNEWRKFAAEVTAAGEYYAEHFPQLDGDLH